ncbi:MAG: helix-hairpin-helix domain-containing protein [Pseudomonadota bacterium]|nr:helix-hairpin-helix domain-containing protein [Pseudomonadota bacterium]
MNRTNIKKLSDIPNIGKAMSRDLMLIDIHHPSDLIGKDPYQLYDQLCQITQQRHDHCVIDTFIAAVRYMEGAPAEKWWTYTAERKATLRLREPGMHITEK